MTHDRAPLHIAIRNVQNAHQPALFSMHDEMFLCAQLFEEAKHVEWFERWWANFDQTEARSGMVVAGAYVDLFEQRLPLALNRVLTDHSSEALTTAFCTYHMIIEGVLAETGYHGYKRALHDHGLMPGTVRAVELVQRDEARHIAYGIHALQRLLSAQPHLRGIVDDTLNALKPTWISSGCAMNHWKIQTTYLIRMSWRLRSSAIFLPRMAMIFPLASTPANS